MVAVFQMAGDVGAAIGPTAAGWVADAHGYGPGFLLAAVVCLAPLPAVLAARETLVPAVAAPAGHGNTPDVS